MSDGYVTNFAEIVAYCWWAAQTALGDDWDTMGVARVVRDSLWNASCAGQQRRQEVTESWAHHTCEVVSNDMSIAPPLIVAQLCNLVLHIGCSACC